VSVREELRDDIWLSLSCTIFRLASILPRRKSALPFRSVCSAGRPLSPEGKHITAVFSSIQTQTSGMTCLNTVKRAGKTGIENKWSYRFACCRRLTAHQPVH